MTVEMLKMRTLPTPRWTIIGALAVLVLTIVIAAFTGVGDDVATGLGADLPTAVAAVIIGVWIVGVEYGQRAMHRTLTADPRRGRVFLSKLGAALLVTAVLTVVVYGIAAAALPPIASAHDEDLGVGEVLRMGVAALTSNLPTAAIGVGVGFITRSMAGGITIALVFIFVVDSALSAIPHVGDYAFQAASIDVWEAVLGRDGDHDIARAVAVMVVWVAAFLVAGFWRCTKSDA